MHICGLFLNFKILEAQLGKYVDGLRSDSLVVGLWSGEVELRDLRLKPYALAELQLPVIVACGTVARVLVRVPWNQLGSASVAITLEGVTALVVPNTERPTLAELLQTKQNQLERRELIRQHRRFAARVASRETNETQQTTKDAEEDEGTFVSRLTARIVANLHVALHNVHIRYEDTIANPATPFACGLILKQFGFYTTNHEGKEAFVDHTSGHHGFTYKKAQLTHFGLYWDRLNSQNTRLATKENVHTALQEMLGPEQLARRQWVLQPCSIAVQLTKNESTNYATVAKYTVKAQIEALQGQLSREQYQDVMYVRRAFLGRQAVEAHFVLARGRPLHPPGARPCEWWDYATRLVLERWQQLRPHSGTYRRYYRKMRWSSMHRAQLEGQLYRETFRTELRQGSMLDCTTREGQFKHRFEEIYPLDVILRLRDVAQDAHDRQAAAARQAVSVPSVPKGGSWYSYFFGETVTQGSDQEHVLSVEGRDNLRLAYEDEANRAQQVPFGCNRVSIQLELTQGTLALYQSHAHLRPFVTGTLHASMTVNLQPDNDWDAQIGVHSFNLVNGLARDPRFQSVCRPSTVSAADIRASCVSIDMSRRAMRGTAYAQDADVDATFNVRIRSQPIRVLLDVSFVLFLHAFFATLLPENERKQVWHFATSSVAEWMFANDTTDRDAVVANEAREADVRHSLVPARGRVVYDVVVDVEAPVLILPECVGASTGAVVVMNLGKLRVCNADKRTGGETPNDRIQTAEQWRVEVTQIFVSLGCQEDLVDWTDDEIEAFGKIVEDLSIQLLLDTRVSSSRLCFPSHREHCSVTKRPHVGVYADIPMIVVSLADEQLVALSRLHSSLVTQVAQQNTLVSITDQQDDNRSDESAIESAGFKDKSNDAFVGDDVFGLEVHLSLECVELHLHELTHKEAFVIRASHSSFALEKYTTHQCVHARLKALVMEDRLYSSTSRFFQLMSTGQEDSTTPPLIVIDLVTCSRATTAARRPVLQLEADIHFNVLHVQWNPSSMALFYRLVCASTSPDDGRQVPVPRASQNSAFDNCADAVSQERAASLSALRTRGRPTVVVRASLVQVSVTLNKDQQERPLARLEMTNSAIKYTQYAAETGHDASEVTGHVGNVIGTDLSTVKHPLYAMLLGLDEGESRCRPTTDDEQVKALVTFDYVHDTVVSDKSRLCLSFLPIRGVYYHQQILELVDFVFEGVLGAIVSQTLMNATQLLLREDEAKTVLDLSVEKLTLILPLSLQDAPHAKVTTDRLRLVHYPSSIVHYDRQSCETRSTRIVHDEGPPRAMIQSPKGTSLRVDCKDLFLDQVRIYCTRPTTQTTSDHTLTYDELLPHPADLKICIEDLVSSILPRGELTDEYLPRFTVHSVLPPLEVHISRTSYLGIVALVLKNFGADDLPNALSKSCASQCPSEPLASRRPVVTYSYRHPDAISATLQVRFVMEKVRIVLLHDALTDVLSTLPCLPFQREQSLGTNAFADVIATDFALVYRDEYDKQPCVTMTLGAFCARDLMGKYSDGDNGGTLMVSPEPLVMQYTWDETAATGDLDFVLSKVTGTVCLDSLLTIVAFLTLPSTLDRLETLDMAHGPDTLLLYSAPSIPSPSVLAQRASISDILSDGTDAEMTMTIRVTAKQVGVALPRNAYDLKGPRVAFTGDFTLESVWRPQAKQSTTARDLDIQCSVLFDARNMEIVLEHARRPGCCVASPVENGQYVAMDVAPLIQILEPSSLHVEVSDLFPHAGQRQQIVSLKFTPIQVYVSYEDACIGVETFDSIMKAIEQHTQQSTDVKQSSQDASPVGQSLTRLRSSSKKGATRGEKETEVHRYVTCELPSMSLTIVNDYDGCDMGLVQLQLKRCHVFLNVTYSVQPKMIETKSASVTASDCSMTTLLSGGGNLVVLVSYYNPGTRDWHPVCTDWTLAASVQGVIASENELHVILTASQALDLTITHGLLEVVVSVGGAWNHCAARRESVHEPENDDREQRKVAPCVIRNETGLPLRFWLTNKTCTTKPHVVATGKLADVRYLHASGRGRGVVRRYASGDREAANLRLCIQLMDSKHGAARFQAVEGLVFEQLGNWTFPLVDTQGTRTSFVLSLSSELVEGRILLVVSSPIKLVSYLSPGCVVALLVNDPTWHAPVEIGILRSMEESAVPVLLSLASELRVRPVAKGVVYAWSAPIPVQTRSAAELKVEAAASREPSTSHRTAVYCISILSLKDMRTVSFAEPLVLVNKLPISVKFRVQSAYSSAYGPSASPSEFQRIAVGAKTSIWWTDVAQRPLFQLEVEGCTTLSKWLELAPRGTVNGAVLSVQLARIHDGRPFHLLVRVGGGTESMARPVRIELLAHVWMINRSGLELVYGTAADGEAYVPPCAALAQVGNAQISPYSGDRSDNVPVLRIGLRGCNWSAQFQADPKRLSWQDECIILRSAVNTASGRGVLYELGVSADYATRHFGSVTTLVSVIPRYLMVNRSSHTVLLLEAPTRQSQRLENSRNENVAHHVLGSGDWYALYWVGGIRAPLRASVLPRDRSSASFCADGYDWSAGFAIDQVGTTNVVVPPRSSGRGVNLAITVKRGSFSQATFVVVVTEPDPTFTLSSARSTTDAIARTRGWQTFTLHAQVAGVNITVTDKHTNRAGGLEAEAVARATLTRIKVEATWSLQATAANVSLMGLQVEDLLPRSKHRVVLRPLGSDERTFLELTYFERPHAKFTWVERVHVKVQDAKVSTSMSFVDRLYKLQEETCAHFHPKSLVAPFPSDHAVDIQRRHDDEDLLAYFVVLNEEGHETDLTAMTGRKVYIASGEISPVRVIVSFTRDKRDARQREGFWLSHLKLQIDNACVTLEGYRLSHALATQESLGAALVRFYHQSVKSQALNLLDSIQVTSLVTSMVTEGVTSLVSTLRGKADPAAAASALAPELLTSSGDTDASSFCAPFQYEHLSNEAIVAKHSRAVERCRSNAAFLRQVRHLVYDWDANHTGLGARGCVAVALMNNSRHALIVNTQLNDGASLHVLPLGRRHLAGVLDPAATTDTAAAKGSTLWRPDRALVVFAYGYTPTLLTSGEIYFTVQSNACHVYATRKTARFQATRGYTATFTLQETQSWWAVHVVIIGDDLHSTTRSISDLDTGDAASVSRALNQDVGTTEHEYEIEFATASLGLIAKQSGHSVLVRECVAPSAAKASGRIAPGDCIVAVNGVRVANTVQFKNLVMQTPRPLVVRFRSTKCYVNAACDLFGEGNEHHAKHSGSSN